MTTPATSDSGYADVNGIKMYYEIYGKGAPLVLIHGGGSTIRSTFGRIIPKLTNDYTIIAVELQNHGRSGNRSEPQTFEQDADDVVALLQQLKIEKAAFLGFSNGGTTVMQIALRHPSVVDKMILASACYKRAGLPGVFFEGMKNATLDNMPPELKAAFMDVNPDSSKLKIMFEKDKERMLNFTDMTDEQLRSINKPALVLNGDHDVVSVEHALEMSRLLPQGELAILPGGHGKYLEEITTISRNNHDADFVVPLIKAFIRRAGNKKE